MIVPKTYTFSEPYRGRAGAAFDVARPALLALGFDLRTESSSELHAKGPGMQSTQQPALLGVSAIRFVVASSSIRAEAVLGGVSRMMTFIYLFPPGLAAVLAASFALAGMQHWWVALLTAAPWVLIAPLLASVVKRRTMRAVEALVRSMAREGERISHG